MTTLLATAARWTAALACAAALACSDAPAGPVKVTVTDNGYEPWKIPARQGQKLVLLVTRVSDRTCATEIVSPELGLDVKLPLNQPVRIELVPPRTGELKFSCAMKMFQGVIDVR